MKKIIAAIRKEHKSELDKFNKLHNSERAAWIILAVMGFAFLVGGHAYDLGEYLGEKIGSMIV